MATHPDESNTIKKWAIQENKKKQRYKKNQNLGTQSVHPLVAMLVVLLFVGLIAFKYWASGEALKIGGPNQMQHDAQGNLFIAISDTIYKLSPKMELLNEYHLKQYGVYDLVGDFAFFSNGDILLRNGHYQLSLLEGILAYLRISHIQTPAENEIDEGLMRCQLEEKKCTPFSLELPEFKSSHHLVIDWKSDEVYVSNTPQHTIYKLNAEGEILAKVARGFRFPNSMALFESGLYVADTNHHLVRVLDTETENFGQVVDEHWVTQDEFPSHIWVYSFEKVGDQWWVNNMGDGMKSGIVFVFDKNWILIKQLSLTGQLSLVEQLARIEQLSQAEQEEMAEQFELRDLLSLLKLIMYGEEADPVDIKKHGDYVLITDQNYLKIHALKPNTQIMDFTWPTAIKNKLTHIQEEKDFYEGLNSLGTYLFILFFILGIAIAIWQNIKSKS